MAFSFGAIWQVQTDGDDTNNGGGFDCGVAGFPTDGAATVANTSSPVFTSASYTFVAGDVGAWIYIKSGTNWIAGFYQIASVSAGAATLSAAIGQAVLIASGTHNASTGMSTVTGCATVASPTGATWGIDYSQSASVRLSFTDMVIGGTTTQFTSAGNPVGKNFVGNIIKVLSGTGFTVQRVAVASTSGTTATCDKSLGTGGSTGGTGKMGGALASGGIAHSLQVSNVIFIKAGTYSITIATTDVSGGAWNNNVFGTNSLVVGYSTNRWRGNTDTRPVIQFNASTITLTNNNHYYYNLDFDGNSQTASKLCNGSSRFIRCTIRNFTAASVNSNFFALCTATGNSAAVLVGSCYLCEAYGNTATPFASSSASNAFVKCLSYDNTGASTDGFTVNSLNLVVNCTAYNNGRHGFICNSNLLVNCHSEGNASQGYNGSGSQVVLLNCGSYNNAGGRFQVNSVNNDINPITLTASAFLDAANHKFDLNSAVGGGALLQAAGFGSLPRGLITSYEDVGPIQHPTIPPFGVIGPLNLAAQ